MYNLNKLVRLSSLQQLILRIKNLFYTKSEIDKKLPLIITFSGTSDEGNAKYDVDLEDIRTAAQDNRLIIAKYLYNTPNNTSQYYLDVSYSKNDLSCSKIFYSDITGDSSSIKFEVDLNLTYGDLVINIEDSL